MRLLGWLRRVRCAPSHAALAAAGVRTESDAEYRRTRIDSYIELMGDQSRAKVAELEAFLDLWLILETSTGFLAFPGWDDEPLVTRDTYPTREDAAAAVTAVGGTLRTMRTS